MFSWWHYYMGEKQMFEVFLNVEICIMFLSLLTENLGSENIFMQAIGGIGSHHM